MFSFWLQTLAVRGKGGEAAAKCPEGTEGKEKKN